MICVKIELWPATRGGEAAAEEIGRMYIANVGGSQTHGDYAVAVCRKGSTEIPEGFACTSATGPKAMRTAHVTTYPRLAYNIWRLVLRSLVNAFPEDKRYQAQEFFGKMNVDPEIVTDENQRTQ